MTAFRARALFGAFLLIFAGVAVNAMLLQEEGMPWSNIALLSPEKKLTVATHEPKRRRVRRILPRWNATVESGKAADQGIDSGASAPSGAGSTMTAPVPATTISVTPARQARRSTVRAIQRELVARGYEPGPVDGILGVMTRAAIMAYEHDEKLPLTAEPTEALLERIILGGVGQGGPAKRVAPGQNAKLLARSVQDSLARLGYVPGTVDGIVSTNTSRAIKAFERDHNLVPTGRISGRLVSEMGRVNGARFSVAAGW